VALTVGEIVEGKVSGITHFGAFIALPEGQTGLVHISEVAEGYVRDVKDYFKQDDVVKVKVLNMEQGKIALSIRQAAPAPEGSGAVARRPERRPERRPAARSTAPVTFEDKLTKFMKDSNEIQSSIRRSTDSKRGGRGGGRSPSMR
jgi:S1 RNA binding domain protein